ncbi:4HBT domain-containing protein [Mycena venus]|uniref:4HBT domain-containing protein n=1 Tax=Mycena venus TaxID=2733690 RepID=A0A8H6Z2E3_9AGAR|nr:4HBT domain-containing protein [Mycena venus]
MAISGNLNPETLKYFSDIPHFFGVNRKGFGDSIIRRLVVTHASVDQKAEEPLKQEGRIVCELIVTEDMLNGGGNVHGGCSAFLIDVCSTFSILALQPGRPTVSQSLNIVYHSPATLGETLRIVNTTIAVGARAISARTEIWNATKHRLVASGVHIKMEPSEAKL